MGLNIKDLKVTSTAFEPLGRIPTKHTGDGEDVSPQLQWSGVPEGTRQLALICHDPDAPLPHGFTHWVVSGIPADVTEIPEGEAGKFAEGRNDFGNAGYNGPLPPEGHGPHHYYFWVYALSTSVDGAPSRAEFVQRHGDAIIEQNRVIGVYEN
jgi:Raf kinase inhibitor-like YbhB/YbcL family protein